MSFTRIPFDLIKDTSLAASAGADGRVITYKASENQYVLTSVASGGGGDIASVDARVTSVENHVNIVSNQVSVITSALASTDARVTSVDTRLTNTSSALEIHINQVSAQLVSVSAALRSDITSARNQVSGAITALSATLRTDITSVFNQLVSVSAVLRGDITSVHNEVSNAVSVNGVQNTNITNLSLAVTSIDSRITSVDTRLTNTSAQLRADITSVRNLITSASGDVVGPTGAADNAIARFDGTTGKLIQGSSIAITDAGAFVLPAITPTYTAGQLFYDVSTQSMSFHNNEADVTQNLGQETWIRVRNVTGSTILNGKAVYINGVNTSLPTVALAQANAFNTALVAGIATHDIENNTNGYITVIGRINGVATGSFTAGDTLYLSETSAGDWRNTPPTAPNWVARLGTVVVASTAPAGAIQVYGLTRAYGNGTANSFYMMDSGATSVSWRTPADAASVIGLTATSAALRADITSARNQVSGAITALSATLRTDITSVYNFASNGLSVAAAARTSLRSDITSVYNQLVSVSAVLRSDITSVRNLVRTNLVSLADVSLATTISDGYMVAWSSAKSQFTLVAPDKTPVGQVVHFAMASVPPGFLECNGQAVSRTLYPDLFAAISVTYGAGDGSTTFNVPDLRGDFIRGWDNGRGVDTGRIFGSSQLDALQGHFHSYTVDVNPLNSGNLTPYMLGPTTNTGTTSAGGTAPLRPSTTRNDVVVTAASDGTNGTPRIASETRPRNVALFPCIKAFSAVVNVGSLDVVSLANDVTNVRNDLTSVKGVLNLQGSKAWVSFNGISSVSILGSYNVAGLTRINAGRYRVTFTVPFTSVGYVMAGYCGTGAGSVTYYGWCHTSRSLVTTSVFDAVAMAHGTGPIDVNVAMIAFFGV